MLSVSSTPILENTEPMGPRLKGITYMVRPFIEPRMISPALA